MKRWLIALALLLCLPACLRPMADPDLPWHLSAARWMVVHTAVPRADFLSWTRAGRPWVDFEWASELALYGLHSLGGERALWAFKSSAFLALLLCLVLLWRRWGVPDAWIAAALPPAALAFVPYLSFRPELFSVFLCLLQLAVLEELREDPGAVAPGRLLAFQAALYVLWANLHAAFPLGLALCVFYAAQGGRVGRLALAGALAGAVGSLVNPYGWKLYGIFLQHGRDWLVMRNFISEWTDLELFKLPFIPHLGLLVLAFAAPLCAVWQGAALPRAHLLILIVVGLFASGPFRHSIYIPLILLPLALKTCLRVNAAPWWRRLRPWAAAGIVLFTLIADRDLLMASARASRAGAGDDSRPVKACRFLKAERAELKKLRLFNTYNCGGYVGYELYPDYPVFVDGRYLFTDMLPPLESVYADPAAWNQFVDRFGIELVLFNLTRTRYKDQSPQGGPWRPFDVLAMPERDWALVYWDDVSMIFVRRRSASADWLKRREFRYLRPGDLQVIALKTISGMIPFAPLAAEVERYRKEIGAPGEVWRLNAWLENLRRETGHPVPAPRSAPKPG